jgi:hypothetical protein
MFSRQGRNVAPPLAAVAFGMTLFALVRHFDIGA